MASFPKMTRIGEALPAADADASDDSSSSSSSSVEQPYGPSTTVIHCPPTAQHLQPFRRTDGTLVWRSAQYGHPEQWFAVCHGRLAVVEQPADLCAHDDVQFLAPTSCIAPGTRRLCTRYTVLRAAGTECAQVYIDRATGRFVPPADTLEHPPVPVSDEVFVRAYASADGTAMHEVWYDACTGSRRTRSFDAVTGQEYVSAAARPT